MRKFHTKQSVISILKQPVRVSRHIAIQMHAKARIARAHCVAVARRCSLPPGSLSGFGNSEVHDQQLLLKLTRLHGPIFKTSSNHGVQICIADAQMARRALNTHADSLQLWSPDLAPLFKYGFLRQMRDQTHRTYRKVLVRDLNAMDMQAVLPDLGKLIDFHLSAMSGDNNDHIAGQAEVAILAQATTAMLIRVFFGAELENPQFKALNDAYFRMGPEGFVWPMGAMQKEGFRDIHKLLNDHLQRSKVAPDAALSNSVLGRIFHRGSLDDTIMGNLIYMVETGRYDLRGLFRWLLQCCAQNPHWLDQIADAEKSDAKLSERLAIACVLETLRLNQSERLMRTALNDFEFEGYLIPKGAAVRICMWEIHKNAAVFPDPFKFCPTRHLGLSSPIKDLSPFGLDHHRCPVASLSVTLCSVFLRQLARGFSISQSSATGAVFGAYHWEPCPDFAVKLTPRVGSACRETLD